MMRSGVRPCWLNAQGQAPDGDDDQRRDQDGGDAHGDAQHGGRAVVGLSVLIGGVDEDDQGGGGGQDQGGAAAGVPQAAKAGEGQGGEEAGGQHGHDQQQPGQQHQADGADAPDQAVAHVRQMHRRGEDHGR